MAISNGLNEESNKKSIKEIVLEKIKAGKIRMIPRWHFVLRAALLAVGFVIFLLSSLYIVSLILFILRKTGIWLLPIFGIRGIGVFFTSIPWLLVILGVVFIIILELLVRHYSFGYRKPLLYSVVGIIFFVAGVSVFLLNTQFHEGLYKRAHIGRLPIVGQLYRNYESMRNNNAHIGTITEITDNGFGIENPRGEILSIIVTSETSFPLGLDFQKGDRVLVLGDRDDDTVNALGIQRIDDGMMPHHRQNSGWYRPPMPIMGQ